MRITENSPEKAVPIGSIYTIEKICEEAIAGGSEYGNLYIIGIPDLNELANF